jgi:predicted kinase
MCGLAFSGKTTVSKRIASALGLARISLDEINHARGLDAAAGLSDAEWEVTSHMAMDQVSALLAAGQSVIVDDTFSHRFLRERLRSVAKQHGASFRILFLDVPRAVCEARIRHNRSEGGRSDLFDNVFQHHADRFQRPQPDEAPTRLASEVEVDDWIAQVKAERDRVGGEAWSR